MVLFIVFLVIHCLFKVALQNNLMQRLSLVQVLPRFVKELLLSWHSNDWFKRVLVDYPWLCDGLCRAAQCPSVHSRPRCPLKPTTPSQAHNAHTRPQHPFKAAMPTQGHSAHSRPQCPHKAIVSTQRMGELSRANPRFNKSWIPMGRRHCWCLTLNILNPKTPIIGGHRAHPLRQTTKLLTKS